MHYTVELLLDNSEKDSLVSYYSTAKALWEEILKSDDAKSVSSLAKRISSEQRRFEHSCGGRWVGQEIMAIVGLAQFYSTQDGFGDNISHAKLVYDAFRASFCSVEVKGHAETVARSYNLLDELEEFGDE